LANTQKIIKHTILTAIFQLVSLDLLPSPVPKQNLTSQMS